MEQVKILVIEDEQELRELYTELLKNAGYAVDVASDGEQGVVALRATKYDLVLLDLILPKKSGLEILDVVQQEQVPTPISSIVILSNVSDDTHIADSVALGVRGYMVKSDVTPDKLLERVREFLGAPSQT